MPLNTEITFKTGYTNTAMYMPMLSNVDELNVSIFTHEEGLRFLYVKSKRGKIHPH